MKVFFEVNGSVVGEYANVWNTRTGDLVRSHIPIHYHWRRRLGLKNFGLTKIPYELLSRSKILQFSLKVLTHIFGDFFLKNESDPKKKLQNAKNYDNRKKLEVPHCLGRRTYAQKQYMMEQNNPGKKVRRVDKWFATHRRTDGTVLSNARSKYDELKAAETRRKGKRGGGSSDSFEDIDGDELVEVFGKDKNGSVRAMGSHISKNQLIHVGVAMIQIEQNKNATEESASLKDEIIAHVNTRLDNFEANGKENVPPVVTMSLNEFSSNSSRRPLSPNLDNVFASMTKSHPENKPPVILIDRFGRELANGYVVMDHTAGVCHFKKVGIGEKKVWIEEVIEHDAPLWNPPQRDGDYNTLAGYVRGGYLIWLESWLKYV